ncbi:hypothetical protein PISMIDRAFT_17969 [Pisolithus microcarpus 441]|uniref:Serine-threonine protein phosphatase N-terminal domain-containing protein n=1 Tax=Pisolithus microcarpus 441 TaxID=765257 RepID=A0A0C9YI63_9AGAM|nr:hypothetical protein PISMIDRAFT_17969 [Pisolithus microcarpus 441]
MSSSSSKWNAHHRYLRITLSTSDSKSIFNRALVPTPVCKEINVNPVDTPLIMAALVEHLKVHVVASFAHAPPSCTSDLLGYAVSYTCPRFYTTGSFSPILLTLPFGPAQLSLYGRALRSVSRSLTLSSEDFSHPFSSAERFRLLSQLLCQRGGLTRTTAHPNLAWSALHEYDAVRSGANAVPPDLQEDDAGPTPSMKPSPAPLDVPSSQIILSNTIPSSPTPGSTASSFPLSVSLSPTGNGGKDKLKQLGIDGMIQRLLDVGYTGKVSKSLCLKNAEIVAIHQTAREIFLSQPTLIELSQLPVSWRLRGSGKAKPGNNFAAPMLQD